MTGRGVEPYNNELLRSDDPERDEQLRVVARVVAVLPDPDDYMPVLLPLLAPMRPAVPPHGNSHSLAWQAARTEWLERVRAWVATQGRVLASRQISDGDQRAYETATGDYFKTTETRP